MKRDGRKKITKRAHLATGDGVPTEDQLALINGLALRTLTADEVYVRGAILAHNGIDRDKEAFSDGLLKEFAETIPGKGFFKRHPGGWDGDSGPGLGRWFSAAAQPTDLKLNLPPGKNIGLELKAWFFIPKSKKNRDDILDIDTGVASYVSIGFTATSSAVIEDSEGKFLGRMLYGPGEGLEGSLVWLGAQPGAQVKHVKGGDPVDEEFEALQGKYNALMAHSKEQKEALAPFKGVNLIALQADATLGKAYREELVQACVKADRLAGMVGDKPEEVKAAEEMYAGQSAPYLQKWLARGAPVATTAPPEGSDPNHSGASPPDLGKGKTPEQKAFDPLLNPAAGGGI